MDVVFTHKPAGKVKPVVFDTIVAEKNGGGLLANASADVLEGMAVGLNDDGKFAPIKGYMVFEDAGSDATTIKVVAGSGVATGDVIGVGGKGVACTDVTPTDLGYDLVTVTLGVAVKKGQVLYQAKSASDSAAKPIYTPAYLIGEDVPAGVGDKMVKLVNVANIRKETAPVADEVVALMKGIQKI